ncbi:M48 family metallopeptidase [Ruegeria arenilitoris]|uniref:M48 family metallopeptidase n=1 Tax=Ruegeria arenilitoris TaxID=1173585 RepID=UPI00147BA420|nr:M48 family metallopeptidase [Ruegeria arenilitoris]
MVHNAQNIDASVTGRAYPPLSSREMAARLSVDTNTAWLIDDDERVIVQCDPLKLQLGTRVGRAERHVVLPDGTLFLTNHHDALEHLVGDRRGSLLHRYERLHPRLMIVLLACLVGTWGVWKYGLPILMSLAVWMTPPTLIASIDKTIMQTIDAIAAEPSRLPDKKKEEVQISFDLIISALGSQAGGHDYKLEFRNMPGMGPNAMALPNGTIVITDDLINIASPDAVAGVIGHEVGHVAQQHGLRQIYRSAGGFVLISLLAGDTGPILEDVLLEGSLILSLSYSRQHELAADQFGVRLAERAGFDPKGLSEFFDLMVSHHGDQHGNWFSTHPGFKERIEHLDALTHNR